ncbi:MAG TPA: LPXTG cell wall anchor domain-containing protein [Terriglobales bacterium]|nr:LPXTG cell wall anchor domain-containing protein [Terriglobales bacterium]
MTDSAISWALTIGFGALAVAMWLYVKRKAKE